MVEARTLAEAYAYLELSLPHGEEPADYDRYSSVRPGDERYVLSFDGPCHGRWCTAEVSFPADGLVAGPDAPFSYGDGPSRLVDAGQWYAVERAYAAMAESAAEAAEQGDYFAVAQAWDQARAAVAEIEKLLPAGATEATDDCFWSPQGRQIRATVAPTEFARSRLEAASRRYARELAEWTRSGPPQELSAEVEPVDGAAPTAAAPDRPSEPLVARSYAEAHAYMDLHPCDCDSAQFPRGAIAVLSADEAAAVVRYAGPCYGCGRPREFTFRLPGESGLVADSPYRFSAPEDGPSSLLDAGQWLAVADGYAFFCEILDELSDSPGAFADPGEREEMVKCLTSAASAVDEVLKFLPPGADQVPASACWSAASRAQYAAGPSAFGHQRLCERQSYLWRRLAQFTERYG